MRWDATEAVVVAILGQATAPVPLDCFKQYRRTLTEKAVQPILTRLIKQGRAHEVEGGFVIDRQGGLHLPDWITGPKALPTRYESTVYERMTDDDEEDDDAGTTDEVAVPRDDGSDAQGQDGAGLAGAAMARWRAGPLAEQAAGGPGVNGC